MVMALVFAIAMNGFVYWKSDTLALKANGARELAPDELPRLRSIVLDLAAGPACRCPASTSSSGPSQTRSRPVAIPEHAAVAVTTGILETWMTASSTGVLAHELSHVKNRDTLVGTIAATIGGAISFIAQMAQFQMIFGGGRDDNRRRRVRRARRDLPGPDRGADHPAGGLARSRVRRGRSGAALTGDPRRSPRRSSGSRQRTARTASGRGCRRIADPWDRAGRRTGARAGGQPRLRPASTSSIRCRVGASAASSRPTRPSRSASSGSGRWLARASAGPPDPDHSAQSRRKSISPRPARHGLTMVCCRDGQSPASERTMGQDRPTGRGRASRVGRTSRSSRRRAGPRCRAPPGADDDQQFHGGHPIPAWYSSVGQVRNVTWTRVLCQTRTRPYFGLAADIGPRARRRARFGRADLDPDLLAARLPDRFRPAAARFAPRRRCASLVPLCE